MKKILLPLLLLLSTSANAGYTQITDYDFVGDTPADLIDMDYLPYTRAYIKSTGYWYIRLDDVGHTWKQLIPGDPLAKSFNYITRSLNTCFRPSATNDVLATYSVDIATTATLLSGQVGTVFLETYTDNACTTGTQELARFVNGNTQTLGVTVTLVQNVTGTLTGVVPAGKYVKLRTQNNTGTPTFTARPGQETIF